MSVFPLSRLSRNVCFNGPRAGFNFNDGMGGGNLLENNLIFNMVRETQDHGTFNSWNRQPFFVKSWTNMTRVARRGGGGGEVEDVVGEEAGEAGEDGTYVPLYNEIRGNFWMNDYNPQEATDNDDNSAYYETHHNFFPFSTGGLKVRLAILIFSVAKYVH